MRTTKTPEALSETKSSNDTTAMVMEGLESTELLYKELSAFCSRDTAPLIPSTGCKG
jgi:hypothetical protein